MPLTGIADAKTPSQAIEIAFAAQAGLPSANKEVLLIAHKHVSSGTQAVNTVAVMSNCADPTAANTEAVAKFGAGTEAVAMVLAAVHANADVGGSVFPQLKVLTLASTDTTIAAAALTAMDKVKAEYVASCYPLSDTTNLAVLKAQILAMSAAGRVDNNQFGSFGVVGEIATAIGSLPSPDSVALIPVYLRDTNVSPAQAVYKVAAAAAARMAANPVPNNPLDGVIIGGLLKPTNDSDQITVGPSAESETILGKGITPLRVFSNGDVAFVRTVTARITIDGSTAATAYFDNQDWDTLYLWRKTLATRFAQPDFKGKNDEGTRKNALSEMIRLAKVFQKNNMFQAVDQLAKLFVVAISETDRHAFEYKTPVNVIPGLHRKLGRIEASTQFDSIVI